MNDNITSEIDELKKKLNKKEYASIENGVCKALNCTPGTMTEDALKMLKFSMECRVRDKQKAEEEKKFDQLMLEKFGLNKTHLLKAIEEYKEKHSYELEQEKRKKEEAEAERKKRAEAKKASNNSVSNNYTPTTAGTENLILKKHCRDCGAEIEKDVYDYSLAKYTKPLCRECQRKNSFIH